MNERSHAPFSVQNLASVENYDQMPTVALAFDNRKSQLLSDTSLHKRASSILPSLEFVVSHPLIVLLATAAFRNGLGGVLKAVRVNELWIC